MNVPRLLGRCGLLAPDAPIRHAAKRWRIKTGTQESIYRAGRLIEHGRQLVLGLVLGLGLGLGANDRSARAFAQVHGELFATST